MYKNKERYVMKDMYQKIENVNWYKLDIYKNIWAKLIKNKLPGDSNFSMDDIESEIDAAFIYRIKNYKPLANGTSLETYIYSCKKYIFADVVGNLLKEYKKIKNQLPIDGIGEEDEFTVRKTYVSSSCNSEPSYDGYRLVEDSIDGKKRIQLLTKLYEVAIEMDKNTEMAYDYAYIIDLTRQGVSQKDIAEEIGSTQREISRRLMKIINEMRKAS